MIKLCSFHVNLRFRELLLKQLQQMCCLLQIFIFTFHENIILKYNLLALRLRNHLAIKAIPFLLFLFFLFIFFFLVWSVFPIVICQVDLVCELDTEAALLNPRCFGFQGDCLCCECVQYCIVYTWDHVRWLDEWEAEGWSQKDRSIVEHQWCLYESK